MKFEGVSLVLKKCEIWNVGNGNEFQNKIRNICVHVRGKYKI